MPYAIRIPCLVVARSAKASEPICRLAWSVFASWRMTRSMEDMWRGSAPPSGEERPAGLELVIAGQAAARCGFGGGKEGPGSMLRVYCRWLWHELRWIRTSTIFAPCGPLAMQPLSPAPWIVVGGEVGLDWWQPSTSFSQAKTHHEGGARWQARIRQTAQRQHAETVAVGGRPSIHGCDHVSTPTPAKAKMGKW